MSVLTIHQGLTGQSYSSVNCLNQISQKYHSEIFD